VLNYLVWVLHDWPGDQSHFGSVLEGFGSLIIEFLCLVFMRIFKTPLYNDYITVTHSYDHLVGASCAYVR
jgi:hypothetical protein